MITNSTYGQINVGDVLGAEVVTAVETFAGGDWSFTRVTVSSGGRRTEQSDFPVLVNYVADPLLVNVPDADLAAGGDVFADHARDRVVPLPWAVTALHGVALEINRRRMIASL